MNLNSYGPFRAGAFEHLSSLGVRFVELPLPAEPCVARLRAELDRHALAPATVICRCNLEQPAGSMASGFEAARELGVRLVFISAQTGTLPHAEAIAGLRARADLAAECGLTLCLETHPPLGERESVARATLLEAGRPNLGWNFDTGNLIYYNLDANPVREAAAGADILTSVHLKDTAGGYRRWAFPALGDGVVDFPGVIDALRDGGFAGPYTVEVEGIEGEGLDEEAVQERVRVSVTRAREWLGVG